MCALVIDGPKIRFYAGAPLVTSEGLPLGTLCVIDDKPKKLRPEQKSALKAMSRQVIDQLELRLKTIKLANSVMQKDKFFSIIAHDLRSPLSYMYSITQMLQTEIESLEPEQIQEFASILNGGYEDLLDLIEKVMEWSKSEQGLSLFREEEFSIKELIVHTLRLLKPAASKKNIEVFIYHDGQTMVKADKNMVTFAIRNLINNAIKFTHAGGMIKILSEQEGDHVKVAVSDTGTGISAEKLESLFSIGNNKSANGTAGEIGSGIGLQLTKEFIERNGSELVVQSTPGKGSTFSFTLPLV
jgi:signal transduction histidine kinase